MATLATTPCDVKRCSGDEESSGPQPNASPAADQRLDGRKAAQFVRDAEKNKNEIKKLENDRTLSLFCRKNGWTDVSRDLEKYEKVLEEEKEAEKMNLQKQLAKIHNDVRKFQRELSDMKPTPKLIERLTEIMSEVETSINTLKEKQRIRFEELLKEERTCRQEISAYEKKIDNWSLVVKSDTRKNQASTIKDIQCWKASKHQERQTKIQSPKAKCRVHQHRTKEEKMEMTRQVEEGKTRDKEQEEKPRLAEEIQNSRQAKKEPRCQLRVKHTSDEQLRLRKEKGELRGKQREEEQKEKEERKKADSRFGRDPSRLTRPTQGWLERMKHPGPSGEGPVTYEFLRCGFL